MKLRVYDCHKTLFGRLWAAADEVTILDMPVSVSEHDAGGIEATCRDSDGCVYESLFTTEGMECAIIEDNVAKIHDSSDDSVVTVKFYRSVPFTEKDLIAEEAAAQ